MAESEPQPESLVKCEGDQDTSNTMDVDEENPGSLHKEDLKLKDKENGNSKKSSKDHHKKSHKSSKKGDKKSKKKHKAKHKREKNKNKAKDKESNGKKKRKRSLSRSHSRSPSRSRSRSHSIDKNKQKRKRRKNTRIRARRYDRNGYRQSYSRSRSGSRSHSPSYSRNDRHRRRRYKKASSSKWRRRSYSHSHSRSNSRSSSVFKDKDNKVEPEPTRDDMNGNKRNEIKATAPNSMQQNLQQNTLQTALNTNPLGAFAPLMGSGSARRNNTTLQQLLAASSSPYKMRLHAQTIAAQQKQNLLSAQMNRTSDSSLLFKVHLPGSAMALTAIGGINPQITRPARRLYVGNLPVGMGLTEQILTEFFSQCCKGLGIITQSPVLSVWLNSEQTFGFIEFRSIQDTNLSLQLFEGLQLGGRQLRFGRPVDYKQPPENLMNYIVGNTDADNNPFDNIQSGSPAAMLLAQQQNKNNENENNVILNKQMSDADADAHVQENESNILILLNMLNIDDLKKIEEYDDIIDDIECECQQYGNLCQIIVPKIGECGVGRVFLKYETINGAKKCKSKCDGRTFGLNIVKCLYFDEKLFEEKKYNFKFDENENGKESLNI